MPRRRVGANRRRCRRYAGYAADITRTFPANGRFSKPQRALHTLVCAAQAAALAQASGCALRGWSRHAAVATLAEGLLSLGLLKGRLEKVIANGDYKRFYRHKTGHWLGLDVHDVGEYRIDGASRLLEPGNGCSPSSLACIFRPTTRRLRRCNWRGIGIRIEDDVLITREGHRVLTAALERSAEDVERG